MRKHLLLYLTFILCHTTFGQIINQRGSRQKAMKISLQDTIKKYFNYDTLSQISCKELVSGLYSLEFKVNSSGMPLGFRFSNDSLLILNLLFKDAILKSLEKVRLRKRGSYLQLFYFNNILSCNSSYDTIISKENIYKQLTDIMGKQLTSIEKSIQDCLIANSSHFILESVIINDINPNRKKNRTGFWNDIPPRKPLTEDEKRKIEKEIEEAKKARQKTIQ